MSELCLRCDWGGDTSEPTCPRCGAPLYRPEPSAGARGAASRAEPPGRRTAPAADDARDDHRDEGMTAAVEPIRSPASTRSVLAVVGLCFAVVVLVLARGGAEPTDPGARSASAPSSTSPELPNGILVYAAPAGTGASRLWLWDLTEQVVRRGPLVPRPAELTNIASPGYGWIGLTAAAPDGGQQAIALDALGPAARARRIGAGEVVAWTRGGGSVVLVDQGPVRGRCTRDVRVTVMHLDIDGSEVVLDRPLCGEVTAVGRTSLGHFAGLVGPDGADIVGLGYQDAGVLLNDHRLLGVSPGGEMLVSSTGSGGSALVYEQFRGRPVRYVAGGVPFAIDRVLAFGPGSAEALVVGHAGDERGVWSVSLRPEDRSPLEPKRLAPGEGAAVWAAYASDGTSFVLIGARLSIARDGDRVTLEPPDDAPALHGPIVWILREPLTQL